MNLLLRLAPLVLLSLAWLNSAVAIEIVVDYTYDTQGFFDTQEKRDAMQAAADRFSRVIDSSLLAVSAADSTAGWRIGFEHPGTGNLIQLSTAANLASDPISSQPADEYGFPGLDPDTWILFAGGRSLVPAGIGGTATGINFSMTFDDLQGPMHRGLIPNTPGNTANDLPVWGGAIAFDTDRSWHFDLSSAAAPGNLDFYSIALHEIGHALGLATNWNQWNDDVTAANYGGVHAVAAYNQDNQTTLNQLNLASSQDPHWQDNTHQSFIFSLGQPVDVGTVGANALQDLLMEPIANFSPSVSRFELTNVDAAALVDVGWSIINSANLDRNGDGIVNGADVDLACSGGEDLNAYFDSLGSLPGDLDLDGQVEFADFLALSANFGTPGTYSQGDINCDGRILFADFLMLSSNFGQAAASTSAVPEPGSMLALLPALVCICLWRRRTCR